MAVPFVSDVEFEGSVDFKSAVLADGDPGAVGEAWTSQGPGLPPVWAAVGDGGVSGGVDPVIAGMIF